MKLVVAVDQEWGIGNKGDLLARVRADLLHFKELTLGKTVILGSNTLATFPGGKPLKNRKNLVLNPSADYHVEGATVVHSLDELFFYTEAHPEEDFFVIGGASVYRQLLPFCDVAYVTKFQKSFPKDVYFENLDESTDWVLAETGQLQTSNKETDLTDDLSFCFTVYKRISR